jgi:hypothetical protein
MYKSKDSMIISILELFKSKSIDGCIPEFISGKDINMHFNFKSSLDRNYFFNTLCYVEPVVLSVNSDETIRCINWINCIYGLRDPYLTQLRREVKLELVLK